MFINEVLQVDNSSNLGISGGGINGALLALFTELENLFGNLVIGFLVISLLEKLLLEFHELFVNPLSCGFLGVTDDLCYVLL